MFYDYPTLDVCTIAAFFILFCIFLYAVALISQLDFVFIRCTKLPTGGKVFFLEFLNKYDEKISFKGAGR